MLKGFSRNDERRNLSIPAFVGLARLGISLSIVSRGQEP
jgi:uncharacterized cupin superfamily protein